MNIELFLDSLKIMGYGMLGIFAVIIVIMLCLKGLTTVFPEKKQDK